MATHAATITQQPHPGWLLVTPQGHPHSWHQHAPGWDHKLAAARQFQRFTKPLKPTAATGWTVRPGSATELLPTFAIGRATA